MIRSFAGVCLLSLSCVALSEDSTTPPSFEVASVKPSNGRTGIIGMFTYPGGGVTAVNYTLKMFIHEAYAIDDYKILNGPGWMETERFDLEAKPAASSALSAWVPANFKTPPSPQLRQMLQSLLGERFNLKLYRESKREFIYSLAVARGGPKLSEPKDATQQPFVSFLPNGLRGQNATMDLLVERLGAVAGRPVLDRTALKGNFDFRGDYPPDDAGTDVEVRLLGAL